MRSKKANEEQAEIEMTGLPEHQHKVARLREEKEKLRLQKELKAKVTKTFYTEKEGKILKFVVSPGDKKSFYLDRRPSKSATGEKAIEAREKNKELNEQIKGWDKQGVWLKPHEADEKLKEIRLELEKQRIELQAKMETLDGLF